MAVKKTSGKKQLPTWVSVVVIVVVVAAIAVWYSMREGTQGDFHKLDPGAAKQEQDYFEKCKDINFFRTKVPGNARPGLVARQIVPKEWGEENWVPYYDPKKATK
jgi:hypothetical protein